MPKIDTSAHKRPSIGQMRDWIVVCTTIEKPVGEVEVLLTRPGVFDCHARVLPLRGEKILDYQSVLGSENTPSHEITLRTPLDVRIDIRHWIYHQDRFAAAWYRVMSVEDLGGVNRFTVLLVARDTVVDKRADPVTQKFPVYAETPDFDPPAPDSPD